MLAAEWFSRQFFYISTNENSWVIKFSNRSPIITCLGWRGALSQQVPSHRQTPGLCCERSICCPCPTPTPSASRSTNFSPRFHCCIGANSAIWHSQCWGCAFGLSSWRADLWLKKGVVLLGNRGSVYRQWCNHKGTGIFIHYYYLTLSVE